MIEATCCAKSSTVRTRARSGDPGSSGAVLAAEHTLTQIVQQRLDEVKDRYRAREISRSDYEQLASREGALFVGSPQQIVDKILFQHELFHHDRFLVQFAVGSLPHDRMLRSIELLGTEVAPAVRQELARRQAA